VAEVADEGGFAGAGIAAQDPVHGGVREQHARGAAGGDAAGAQREEFAQGEAAGGEALDLEQQAERIRGAHSIELESLLLAGGERLGLRAEARLDIDVLQRRPLTAAEVADELTVPLAHVLAIDRQQILGARGVAALRRAKGEPMRLDQRLHQCVDIGFELDAAQRSRLQVDEPRQRRRQTRLAAERRGALHEMRQDRHTARVRRLEFEGAPNHRAELIRRSPLIGSWHFSHRSPTSATTTSARPISSRKRCGPRPRQPSMLAWSRNTSSTSRSRSSRASSVAANPVSSVR
jgi:hypothetical protein